MTDASSTKYQPLAVEKNESHYDKATWLSKAFFLWPNKLIEEGAKKTLEDIDIPEPAIDDDANLLYIDFKMYWEQELQKDKPSLLRAVVRMFAKRTWWCGVIIVAESVIRIYQVRNIYLFRLQILVSI